MSEEWRSIPGFSRYEASADGRVRVRGGKEMRLAVCASGYRQTAMIADSGKRCTMTAHRAVLMAFVGPCPPLHEGCHYDGDRGNNRVDNLRWDTRAGNFADRDRHGNTIRGEQSVTAKLTNAMVAEIRSSEDVARVIAARLGVSRSLVAQVRNRTVWRHV